jgi:hypothetical protein
LGLSSIILAAFAKLRSAAVSPRALSSAADALPKRPLTHRLAVPPLPRGEGECIFARTLARPTMIFALSIGERGDRKAVGEGSFPNIRHPSRILLPELSNIYCHPGKAGGSPNGLEGR